MNDEVSPQKYGKKMPDAPNTGDTDAACSDAADAPNATDNDDGSTDSKNFLYSLIKRN